MHAASVVFVSGFRGEGTCLRCHIRFDHSPDLKDIFIEMSRCCTRILVKRALLQIAVDNFNQIVDAGFGALAFSHMVADVVFHQLGHQTID